MKDLFGGDTPYDNQRYALTRNRDGSHKSNPMIPAYGTTEGEKCKNCIHLVKKQYSKAYYKCELRGNVNRSSPQSDHRVNWPACGKFKEQE